jgi:hypothetical protein
MSLHWIGAVARAFVFGLSIVALAGAVEAQPQPKQPSANVIALAREIIVIKGGSQLYETIVPGVIERAKGVFLQQNPMIGRDLNEVAARLRTELNPRGAELVNEMAKLYVTAFTEQELKDVLAFYKSSAGKKIITEEPAILEKSAKSADSWIPKFAEEVMAKFRVEMKKKGHEL